MSEKLKPEDPAVIRNVDVDWLWKKLDGFFTNVARIATALESRAGATTSAPAEIDLEAADSDFVVKKMPKSWKGDSFAGKKLSECPSDFLDTFAAALEFKASKEEEEPDRKKWAPRTRLEAAKARAWAKKKRAEQKNGAPSSEGFVD